MRWRKKAEGSDATAAREKAEEALQDARERRLEVVRMAAFVRLERDRNHFRERIERAWGGNPS